MTEAAVAIATLVGRYSLTAESDDVVLSTDITLRPAAPVLCRMSLRQGVS
jgi:hypothetical protein